MKSVRLTGSAPKQIQECFVMMPFGPPGSERERHFQRVFDDLIAPACTIAGYKAYRSDQGPSTSIIHVEIIHRLLTSPMAICDLTDRNPNVMFELGFRQAFDKPVVLIQEEGTERIFDTAVLKTIDYRKEFDFRSVPEDQNRIAASIKATSQPSEDSVNSLVRLVGIVSAKLPSENPSSQVAAVQNLILSQLSELRNEVLALKEKPLPGFIEELKRKMYREGPDAAKEERLGRMIREIWASTSLEEVRSLGFLFNNELVAPNGPFAPIQLESLDLYSRILDGNIDAKSRLLS